MKTLAQIKNEINATIEERTRIEKEIEKLSMLDEIDEAEKVRTLSERGEVLKIKGAILSDNARCALIREALPVISAAFRPYDGKKYGEKTRKKISDTVRAAGFGFYMDKSYIDDSRHTLHIYDLDANGLKSGAAWEAELYAVGNDGKRGYFVNAENVITFSGAQFADFSAKYTEDPERAAEEAVYIFFCASRTLCNR